MPPRNDQAVAGRRRPDVEERHCDVVLVQAPGRRVAGDDPAEDAALVSVRAHAVPIIDGPMRRVLPRLPRRPGYRCGAGPGRPRPRLDGRGRRPVVTTDWRVP